MPDRCWTRYCEGAVYFASVCGGTRVNPNHIVLPKLLPDETLYSLVTRIYRLNGEVTEQAFCARLLGAPEALRVADVEVDLSRFEEITRGFYGDAENLLATTTLALFYRRLGTAPEIEAPKHVPDNTPPQPSSLARHSNGRPNIWRTCWSCITSDRVEHGTSYWHRTHQLPGATLCLKHRERLFELGFPYGERQRAFILPDQIVDRFDHLPKPAHFTSSEVALRISAIAEQALLDNGSGNSAEIVHGALVDGLAERGFLTRGRSVNRRAFVEEVSAFYSHLADTREFRPLLVERSLLRLADGLTASALMLPATLILMLAFWLFGSWQMFRERCEWRRCIDAPAVPVPFGTVDPSPDGSRKEHRQACLEFMESTPAPSRTDFWHAYPKACRWLSQYDGDWLDFRLPLAKKHAPRQFELF